MANFSQTARLEAEARRSALLPSIDPVTKRVLRDFEPDWSRAVKALNETFPVSGHESGSGLRIRDGFSYLSESAPLDSDSDRKAPKRENRPPAGRIASSRGITLQLQLVMLAGRQLSGKAVMDTLTVAGEGTTGWSDLVATGAVDLHQGNTFLTRRDKRLSSVRKSLSVLTRERLISIDARARSNRQVVALLNEVPPQPGDDVTEYRPPKDRTGTDHHFVLPWSFVRQGWVFLLRDSELMVLMMLACGRGRLSRTGVDVAAGETAIPGDIRLGHYGIHRDPFSRAYSNLERFGLIEVNEMNRYDSGRAIDGRTQLHRFKIREDAFERPAFESALAGLNAFLSPTA